MCGRFTLTASPAKVAEHFELDEEAELAPRFNIAPTQFVATISAGGGVRRLEQRCWGLVPRWAKDERIGSRQINARIETVAEKPAYREAFRERRCILPSDGFFEWTGPTGHKSPHHIALPDGGLFGFAGLWESWRDPHGQPLETCTILTTAANELLSALHRRMPVILHPARYAAWLDPEECDPARILAGVDDEIARELTFEPVSLRVNDVGNDDARCLERIESQPGLFG